MNRKQKAAAVAIAAVMATGALAGCDALTTTDISKDYAQVIAEVDLTRSEEFKPGTQYHDLVSGTVEITKRDMVASYVASGYSLQQQYGWTYADTFTQIAESLVSRQVFVQYAKVYLAENGDADGNTYTVEAYKSYVEDFKTKNPNASADAVEAAGIEYFLTDAEKYQAQYDLMSSFNSSLDSLEEELIALEEDDHNHTADSDVRTRPTGAETESEDYYPAVVNGKMNYGIYTGRESAADLGEYEKVEGSRVSTRKKAYVGYLANLRANELVDKGEDTTNVYSLNYYQLQLRSSYEAALISKLSDKLEKEAEAALDKAWSDKQFAIDLENQKTSYSRDRSAFESALDGMSDSSFVLSPNDSGYGFVLNILLPFSDLQTQQLDEASSDFGDENGNKFTARANLLRQIKATDQRDTWFTGHDDFSYEAGADAFRGADNDPERTYLFFENSFSAEAEDGAPAKYEKLKNYYGQYTFNGVVEKTEDEDGDVEYTITPNDVTIDGFLAEMKAYLGKAGLEVTSDPAYTDDYKTQYFANENYYYDADVTDPDGTEHKAGAVDYSKFIYEMGKVSSFNGSEVFTASNPYNANEIFLENTAENTAFSVINELSFAYNTDTAGLNSYLGYSVSPFKTSYMSEFEYAAQLAVKNGAGTYVVVPTDYGWHIIYCTFSFADAKEGNAFTFDFDQRDVEGTFSYNYYETLKATAVSQAASAMQTEMINTYVDACSTIYESRFADLMNLGN